LPCCFSVSDFQTFIWPRPGERSGNTATIEGEGRLKGTKARVTPMSLREGAADKVCFRAFLKKADPPGRPNAAPPTGAGTRITANYSAVSAQKANNTTKWFYQKEMPTGQEKG